MALRAVCDRFALTFFLGDFVALDIVAEGMVKLDIGVVERARNNCGTLGRRLGLVGIRDRKEQRRALGTVTEPAQSTRPVQPAGGDDAASFHEASPDQYRAKESGELGLECRKLTTLMPADELVVEREISQATVSVP